MGQEKTAGPGDIIEYQLSPGHKKQYRIKGFKSDGMWDLEEYAPPSPPPPPEPKSLLGFGENALKSIPRAAGDAFQMLSHPVDTAQSLAMTAGGLAGMPSGKPYSNAFWQGMGDRYGSFRDLASGDFSKLGETAYNDPVGLLWDASSVFRGGAGLMRGGARVAPRAMRPGMRQAADYLTTGANWTDPVEEARMISHPFRNLGGNIAVAALGGITGEGEALRVGKQRPTNEFFHYVNKDSPYAPPDASKLGKGTPWAERQSEMRRSLTVRGAEQELAGRTRGAFDQIRGKRADAYQEWLKQIQGQTGIALDPTDLQVAFGKALHDARVQLTRDAGGNVTGRTGLLPSIDERGVNDLIEVGKTFDEFLKDPANQTVMGWDALKRRLDDMYGETKGSRAFITRIRRKVKDELDAKVPGYAEMSSEYEWFTNYLDEIGKEFNLRGEDRSSPGTLVRKLVSAFKQNNDFRANLLRDLEALGETSLLPALAGYHLSSLWPRGLHGIALGAGTGAYGLTQMFSNPNHLLGMLALAPAASPRLWGNAAGGYGRLRNALSKMYGAAGPEVSSGTRLMSAPWFLDMLEEVAAGEQGEGQAYLRGTEKPVTNDELSKQKVNLKEAVRLRWDEAKGWLTKERE